MKNRQNLYDMIISILIPVAVGSISALISRIPGRYAGIQQPPFSPPAIVFPIVWTALYILMGISAYMISRSEDARKSRALSVYALQLFFNFFWSILFFRFSWYLPAFFWLAAMSVLILIMIFLVIAMEFVNSAIEETVNYISTKRHPAAKRIKDLAAGAVLLISICALCVAIIIIGGKLYWIIFGK